MLRILLLLLLIISCGCIEPDKRSAKQRKLDRLKMQAEMTPSYESQQIYAKKWIELYESNE